LAIGVSIPRGCHPECF